MVTGINQRFGSAVRVCPVLRVPVAGGLIDNEGHAHRAYGATGGTLILVRPDGCVGCIAHDGSTSSIEEYLKNLVAD